jgi:hypothetical protein
MADREDLIPLDAFIFDVPRRFVKKLALALAFIMNNPSESTLSPAVSFLFLSNFKITATLTSF